MIWEAFTDRDVAETGTVVHIDRGYRDIPPQPGEEIRIAERGSGSTRILTVVSSSGDRLEVSDGRTLITLKPRSGERAETLDASGRYLESWAVE